VHEQKGVRGTKGKEMRSIDIFISYEEMNARIDQCLSSALFKEAPG
jgi:hypothetical protein